MPQLITAEDRRFDSDHVNVNGTSGASVDVRWDYAVKSGPGVAEQRAWLKSHSCPTVVRVMSGVDSGEWMTMERLEPLDLSAYLDVGYMTSTIVDCLRPVWKRPRCYVAYDEDAHRAKVLALVDAYSVNAPRLDSAFRAIDWDVLPRACTHGDPTFENVMRRPATGEAVLIDPRPATSAVPDLRCVDLGKVIQSIRGWEYLRYTGQVPSLISMIDVPTSRFLGSVAQDANEALAARYWHVVHLLRTLPYVSRDLVIPIRKVAERCASGL